MKERYTSPTTTAEEVRRHGVPSFPVDVDAICQQEGARILETDMREFESIARKAVAGAICHHPDYGFTILVDESGTGGPL